MAETVTPTVMDIVNETLQIGALLGGGLVLGYRCNSRCRHCLYGCGPHREDGAPESPDALESVLDTLAARGPYAAYHIGGGEPFLNLELLHLAVRGMTERGLQLSYAETNASWVRDVEQAASVLAELAAVGLPSVLVSLSPFHAEHTPLRRTLALIRAAEETLPNGAFVWIPEFLGDMQDHDPSERLDLDAMLAERGEAYARELAARYSLVPAGRAARYLMAHGHRRPWTELAVAAPCRRRLRDTTHFHVDGTGSFVPGLCPGLVLPLEDVPGTIDLEEYPLLQALVRGGPAALVEMSIDDGFVPHPTYASVCDLCVHVRRHLFERPDTDYAELGPAGFYDERSVPGY